MPFNGSGTYTLPAGNPVVTNTPISSTTTNNTNNDIANALTNCLTRDGQSSPTSAIPMSNQKLTGLAKGTIAGDAMRFEQTAQIDETTGENSNIKSITGLTTPLSASQGGSGASSATGTGSNVLSNSPSLVTPALGTPASGVLTNCTGLPLTTGITGQLPVANGGTGVTTSTGSGSNVLSTSPTLVTPLLGTPTSGVLTNCTGYIYANLTGTVPTWNQNTTGTAAISTVTNGLSTSGSPVIINASSPPTVGQALIATSATVATWQTIATPSTFTNDITVNSVTVGQGNNASLSGTAFGITALSSIINGTQNTAVGFEALKVATAAASNTAVGYKALAATTLAAGSGNTALGCNTLSLNTTGSNNTAIGHNALSATGVLTTIYNVGIGANVQLSSVSISNEVNIYNGSVTARFQGAASAWSFVSDERDKTNVVDLTLGLNFISQLKPRVFEWNLRHTDVDKGKLSSGFIAQEVLAIMQSENAMYTNLVDTNDPEQYTFSAPNLIPVLVKAIQELTDKVTALEARIV